MKDGCVEWDEVVAYASKDDAKAHYKKCVAEAKKLVKDYGWEEEQIGRYYCVNEKGNFTHNREEVELITTTLL